LKPFRGQQKNLKKIKILLKKVEKEKGIRQKKIENNHVLRVRRRPPGGTSISPETSHHPFPFEKG
jgi:hypothetical protein